MRCSHAAGSSFSRGVRRIAAPLSGALMDRVRASPDGVAVLWVGLRPARADEALLPLQSRPPGVMHSRPPGVMHSRPPGVRS